MEVVTHSRIELEASVLTTFATSRHLWFRNFKVTWVMRSETSVEIAGRIQRLVEGLGRIEPAWAQIWPHFDYRAVRDHEPHVLQFSVEDLGRVIDRRFRFDPPQLPSPVSEEGYFIFLGTQRADEPGSLGLDLRAGACRTSEWANAMNMSPNEASPIWRSQARGVAVLRTLVETFEATSVLAGAGYRDGREGRRPWLSWARPGFSSPWLRTTERPGRPLGRLEGSDILGWR